MTTCVYCKKEIDSWGDYKEYDCPKIKNTDDWEDVCFRCKFYILEGEEVPAP